MNRKSGMNWKDGLNHTGGTAKSSFTLFDASGFLSGITYSDSHVGDTTLTVTDKIYMYAKRTSTAYAYQTITTSGAPSKNCTKVKITFGTNNLTWGSVSISINGVAMSTLITPASGSVLEYTFERAETISVYVSLQETAYLGASINITKIEFE